MNQYYRPLVQSGAGRPRAAVPLAGGELWFDQLEVICRDKATPAFVTPQELPSDVLDAFTAPRAQIAGLSLDRPRLMGILNVTPDSFSDGGVHNVPGLAAAHAGRMIEAGVDIIDVGGESTRPGALPVPAEAEAARVAPVVRAVRTEHPGIPISVDTRKTSVAHAAHTGQPNGIDLINDVSGFTYDETLAHFANQAELPVCIMHARGDPETMQENPRYDDVVLDVYDFLAAQIVMLTGIGIARERIIIDPGIGFGKKIEHNLALLNKLSVFHGLQVPILVGASRKGFIGKIGRQPIAEKRTSGSVAVALAAVAQGVQFLRVHDVEETRQAIDLWRAVQTGEWNGT